MVSTTSFITIGIRLIMMMIVQQRRERMNCQINERLKILIAAYKTIGGAFTGTLRWTQPISEVCEPTLPLPVRQAPLWAT
jgi:hypothetical protein